MKLSDQDPYGFPLWLKMNAYKWNAAGQKGEECSTYTLL